MNKIKLRRKRRRIRKQIKKNINKLSILNRKSMERLVNLTVLEYTEPSVLDFLCGNQEKYIKDMKIWKQKRQEILYENICR